MHVEQDCTYSEPLHLAADFSQYHKSKAEMRTNDFISLIILFITSKIQQLRILANKWVAIGPFFLYIDVQDKD